MFERHGFSKLKFARIQGGTAVKLFANALVSQRLTDQKEWKFFAVLPKADFGLATEWWIVLILRGILPAAFAIAMGVLVGAVQRGNPLVGPLAFVGLPFLLLQILSPIRSALGSNLGDHAAASSQIAPPKRCRPRHGTS